jgi:RNA polymerase sigma factor (sigma-70 family)
MAEIARMARLELVGGRPAQPHAEYAGPRLTPEQRAIAASWVAFAYRQANKYAARVWGLDLEELQNVALATVAEAAVRFDSGRATTLGALLGLMLRQAFHREACRQRAGGLASVASNLANGRMLFAEVPARFGFDSPVGNGQRVKDVLPGVTDGHEGREDRAAVYAAIEVLPVRHRAVVLRRLAGDTLSAIGEALGIVRERVRQLEADAHAMIHATVHGIDTRKAKCGTCRAAFTLSRNQRRRGQQANYCSPACSREAHRQRCLNRRKAVPA